MFGNLVTFEPAYLVDHERNRYRRYATAGGGLPIVVVPTLAGRPVDYAGTELSPQAAANAVTELARLGRQALAADGLSREPRSREPVRLLASPLDEVQPGGRLYRWAGTLARQLEATVFLADGARFSDHFRDFTAAAWRSFEPVAEDTRRRGHGMS